jgi:hypothetical protein
MHDGENADHVQVLEEGLPGARVVIVDCPSEQYLPALLQQSAQLKPPGSEAAAAADSGKPARLQCVIHLAPAEVRLHAAPGTTPQRSTSAAHVHHVTIMTGYVATS